MCDGTGAVKHLKSGDSPPKIDASKYTLFAFRFCPYCERVRLVLHYHKIDHELIMIALANKPDWFLQMSPSGKVPMLLNEGSKLIESDLIMRFVDELRGADAQLLTVCGLDNFNQALTLTTKFFKPAHSILFKDSFGTEEETAFREACEQFNRTIKGDYFAGNQLSLADFAVFPMLDRLEVVIAQLNRQSTAESVTEWTTVEAESSDWPILANYVIRMRRLPVVAGLRQPTRTQALYAESMRRGVPNPDI